MERRGDPQRFCASRCRDSISALVSACSPSRRDFIRLALAGSSLPFMPSLGLGSGLANDRTRWYRDAKFGMFIHWGTIRAGQRGLLAHNDTHTSGHQRSGVSRVAKAV
ncbi:MAG: hypothetical protein DMG50_16185 [Acidobacteria bacterium]|nr:MAG: hypothetical protein DMG50_16185 [Acidobacteriota bacterium]